MLLKTLSRALCLILAGTILSVCADALADLQEAQLPALLETYKTLHAHPELSHAEEQTAATVAAALRRDGYEVSDHVGVYPDGSKAFGVVGILKNGAGPTLLIRADMDALPVTEDTGLPYASHATTRNPAGQTVGVMHACGHDVHTTVLIGTAAALARQRSRWHGTLMLVGQPSEETIDGAKAMLADHLYERFGTPDMIIGLHDTNTLPAGSAGITPGPAMASSTSIDVTIRGIGGHGSAPQLGRDPVVLAALFITQLQTIVSREEDPRDPAVITVGAIHGGTKRNIIPNEVKLELTARSFSDHARQVILDGVRQMAQGIGQSAGLSAELMPIVTVLEHESTPVTWNDPALSARVKAALSGVLGASRVFETEKLMGSEDVGVFSLPDRRIPLAYFWLGAMNPERLANANSEGKTLPGMHTNRFEPDPLPTLDSGVKALSAAALDLLR